MNEAIVFKVPVALLVFNRPETTRRVFEVIRQVQPAQLFVIGDGPRKDRIGEQALCDKVRQIVKKVDWPCELQLLFLDENLGCRRCVTEGINWVFEQVEQAIILEDDCLPDPSFFLFCEELLMRYSDDHQVGMISGDNFQNGINQTPNSYYFSRFCHTWGWATWRRAWQMMDSKMQDWPQMRNTNWIEGITGKGPQTHFWKCMFDDCFAGDGGLNAWDMVWQYTCWKNTMTCILPRVNLVKNIGFEGNGLHCRPGDLREKMGTQSIDFPLLDPLQRECFREADEWTERNLFYGITPAQRLFWSMRLPFSVRQILRFQKFLSKFFPKPH